MTSSKTVIIASMCMILYFIIDVYVAVQIGLYYKMHYMTEKEITAIEITCKEEGLAVTLVKNFEGRILSVACSNTH